VVAIKAGNREQGTGNREQGTGNKDQGSGIRKEIRGSGELTGASNARQMFEVPARRLHRLNAALL
jgi:hypothetical protein